MRSVHLLGATGSIGTQVCEVIDTLEDVYIQSMSVGTNINKAISLIKKYHPLYVSVLHQDDAVLLQAQFKDIEFGFGEAGLLRAATYGDDQGLLVNALVGLIGLKPTIAAIQKKRDILLANKETLVMAGEIIKKLVKEHQVALIPIDSEHSAIFQCLKKTDGDVKRLILTASGGTFRDLSRDQLKHVTLEDAMKHPNWQMGTKITIDSATMANKGLEVIEAHFLFDMPYHQIDTVLHRESIVHSMVELIDGTTIAQLAKPDMRIPIQYALTYPKRCAFQLDQSLSWHKLQLSFETLDHTRYPLLKMAYDALKQGGIMPAVYNVANEEAVRLFINHQISFLEIEEVVQTMLDTTPNRLHPTLEDIFQVADDIRQRITNQYRTIEE